MLIKGVETRDVKVEVDPKEFLSQLYNSEISNIKSNKTYTGEYDGTFIQLKSDKVLEHYIIEGYDYGHYQQDDKLVCTYDRTEDFSEDYIAYLVGLKNSIKWLSK